MSTTKLQSFLLDQYQLPPASCTISCDEDVREKVHDDQPNVQCHQAPSSQRLYSSAQPIINPVWRGCIYFGDEKYGPLTAHTSTIACERICNTAKLLPPILRMEKLARLQYCPNCFKGAPPTDDRLGLCFFPGGTKVDGVLDQLLDDAIRKDLLLFRFVFDEAELLVFSSTILHRDHRKFQGKHCLWGAFRGRQASVSATSADCPSKASELGLKSRGMEVCYEHAGEREEGEGRDDKYSEATQYNSNFMLSPHSLCCNIPPDLMNTEKKPRGLQTCPSSQKMKGGVGSMIRTMRIMN